MIGPSTILVGDVMEKLRELPNGCVHTVVTSPPYWGLRSYLPDGHDDKHMEIGSESTPDAFVARMVEVFREVRRVLREDGTLWLNLGDSYNSANGGSRTNSEKQSSNQGSLITPRNIVCDGLKPKDLCMMPWRVALALQADGWWLRSIIVWAKKSPMPESCRDRPTSSWEPIFLLAKSDRYYYDSIAVQERSSYNVGDEVERGIYASVESEAGEQAQITTDRRTLPGEPARQTKTSGVFPLSENDRGEEEVVGDSERTGVHQEVPQVLQESGSLPEILPERQRESRDREVPEDGKRKRVSSSRRSQAENQDVADSVQSDSNGVERDQGRSEQSVRCVRAAKATDAGSHHSAQSGGTAHEVQHPSVVPFVQQPQRQSVSTRNLRNVWHLGPEPYRECHFATFPTEIPRRAIKAGTSEKGCCPKCGAGWVRMVSERGTGPKFDPLAIESSGTLPDGPGTHRNMGGRYQKWMDANPIRTLGWSPSCSCNAGAPVPCLVLDPFLGSGTTVAVARELGRHGVGIELNAAYAELARERIGRAEKPQTFRSERDHDAPLFAEADE